MSVRAKPAPKARQRSTIATLVDDSSAGVVHEQVSQGVEQLETRVGQLEKLKLAPPTVTGSRGGNAALASLLSALAGAGLIKDGTT